MKRNTGITLIALIMTVVILLILAGVAINAISKNSIADKAKNAANKYNDELNAEQEMLLEYEYQIEKVRGTTSAENYTEYAVQKFYGIKIGDYVEYNPTPVDGSSTIYTSKANVTGYTSDQLFSTSYAGDWQVLGIDGQKLKLISTDVITRSSGEKFTVVGEKGYLNIIDELNNICSLYGHGANAISARSVNAEDLMKISYKFDPNIIDYKTGNGAYYNSGKIGAYGATANYKINGNDIEYTASNGATKKVVGGAGYFLYVDKENNRVLTLSNMTDEEKAKTYTVQNSLMYYYPSRTIEQENLNIQLTKTNWYNLLYTTSYACATDRIYANPGDNNDGGYVSYGIHVVGANNGFTGSSIIKMVKDENNAFTLERDEFTVGIRPVVTINIDGLNLIKEKAKKDSKGLEHNVWKFVPVSTQKIATAKDTTAVANNKYSYGDEYTCDLGDGIARTFYLLEDGDNTSLGTKGLAKPGQVSLIMDSNIGTASNVNWSADGSNHKNEDASQQAVTAKAYLAEQTAGWTKLNQLQITLPTKEQIVQANNNQMNLDTNSFLAKNMSKSIAYWTSTPSTANTKNVWRVLNFGTGINIANNSPANSTGAKYGVRPVITIQKSQLQ